MNQIEEIRSLIDYLNEQTHKYNCNIPDITDKEYDDLYFQLKKLEDAYHIYYPDSPTQSIQYQVVNSLEKVTHNHDMLSLDKTKSLDEVKDFLGNAPYIAMLKMDGLTCSLMYEDGQLVSAETRGNGQVGENILHNARVVKNIPQQIPYKNRIVVDGEIICKLDDFDAFADEYKNTRNFASGSIRLLDSAECAKRNLSFVAWEVIKGLEEIPYLSAKLSEIASYGFTIVPWITEPEGNHKFTFDEINGSLVERAKELFYPIDGLVFKFNDWRFGESFGQTGHHARNAIAYKFYDEEYETTLLDIEWQVGRTGQITPIAKYEPIEIDGSVCEKASLHNLSVLEGLSGGFERKGDKIWIYKANAIIPQVSKWEHTGNYSMERHIFYPEYCPICGNRLLIKNETDSRILFCDNSECGGRVLNKLKHFVSKSCLDIKGLSEQTLNKLLDWGWIESAIDIFSLQEHRDEWVKKPGFGIKSVDNILNAISASKQCNLSNFICSLGIPLIGVSASKQLANTFGTWEEFIEAVDDDFKFYTLPDFGPEAHKAIMNFDFIEAEKIAEILSFKAVAKPEMVGILSGLTFVITGKVSLLGKNRDEVKSKIENLGGKVVGSVSKNTNYLINNDFEGSTSSKNQTAKKLGVPIISEEKFKEIFEIS